MMFSDQTLTIMRLNVLFQVQAQRQMQKNHGNSNFNNRLDETILWNNNEIKYFLLGPSKESDKKQALKYQNNYKRNLKMCVLV